MRDTVQSPINYSVTSQIKRGRVDETAIIINQSLTATVWVSSNPGMSPGQGTVISPGTYLTWTRKGDVYLILGNDVNSVNAGSALVTITYDVSDWSPNPIAIASAAINRQQAITTNLAGALTIAQINALTSNGLDASLFNSLDILASPSNPGTGGTQLLVRQYLTLADAQALNTPFWTDSWQWYGTATAGGGNYELRVQIPLRAPYIRWTVAGSPNWTFGAALSSQLIPDNRYGFTTLPKNGIIADMTHITTGNCAVAPATVSSFTSGPYGGDMDVYMEVAWGVALGAGITNGWVSLFTNNSQTIQNRILLQPMVSGSFAALGEVIAGPIRISSPVDQLLVVFNNNIATATTGYRILLTAANAFRGN